MNEENQFSIDVQAESESLSSSLESTTFTPSEFINMQPDLELGKRIFLQATPVDVTANVSAESSQVYGLDFAVKIDPEAAYQKAEMLEQSVMELGGGFKDLYNNLKKSWIPIREKDEFEERPIIESNNLIFYARRDKMSMAPLWS